MISYDSYINRIQKVAKVKNFVVKYKFLIIGVLAVIIAGVTALLATKGMVTSAMVLDARYSYGESYSPTSATAFLSDVTYEYSLKGTDEWTEVKPVKVGTYLARTVTDKAIGKGYGDPVEFEISPKEVELSIVSDTMTYGDAPVCAFDNIVSAYGDKIYSAVSTYDLPKTDSPEDMRVDVTVNKVIVLDKDGNDSSECYSYSAVTKTLTLNKRALNVAPVSRTETYSGAPVSTEVEIDPSVQQTLDSIKDKISSYNAEFTLGGATVIAPQNAGAYGISLKDVKISHNGVDATHLYNISYGGATLNIAQKSLSITTASEQKTYDGSPISKADGIKHDGLISGHKLSAIGSAPSLTDAGTTPNAQYFEVYDASNAPVTDNYNISYSFGTLTVTPREVTVTLNDIADVIYGNSVVYGGGGKITNAIGECTVDIKNVNLQYSPLGNYSYPDAGSYKVLCDANDISISSGGKVTSNYKVTAVNGGSLTITPRQISVTLYSYQVEYGTTLPVPSHSIGGDGLASGEQFKGAYLYDGAKATLLNVGSHTVSLDTANCSFTNRNGGAVSASNYTITSVGASTITVFSRGITVYLKDETAVYGNKAVYSGGYKSVLNLADGQTVTVDASKVVVPAGTPDVGDNYVISCPVSAIQILNNGTDVTANYTVAVVQGTFKITPRPITVQAEDMSGVIYGEKIEYTGNYANSPDLVIGETLTVLSVKFNFNEGDIPAVGNNYTITPNGVQILKADGTNSTNNYRITPSNGALEIVQRPVTIRSENKDFVYNGSPRYYEGNSVADDSPYDILRDKGHRIAVSGHATITDVGTTPNALDYTVYDSFNNPVTANYKITKIEGTLKVTARPISVTLNTYSAIYGDSYAYATGAGNYANYPDLVGGDTLEITAVNYEFGNARYPDARTAAYRVSKASFKITKPDGRTDSANNYNVTWTDGALTIERRTITVVLNTYSAIYGDSYAYKTGAGNYANTPDLVSGETLEITAVNYEFGNLQYPDVREAAYTVSLVAYKILKSDGTTSSYNNYSVIPVDGALTITKRAISVTLKDLADITYGEAAVYSVGGEKIVNAIGNCTVNFDTDNLQFNAKATSANYSYPDAGDYSVDLNSDIISILSSDADVTGNYTVTVNGSSLTINKRTVTVYLYDYSVDYGDEHDYVKVNNGGYDYLSFGSLASFDGVEETLNITSVTYKLGTAKYPVVGEYGFDKAGCEILKANGAVGNNNYAIDFDGGLLTVNKRAITLTSDSYEWTYDGAAHNGLDGDGDGYEITDGSLPDDDFKIVPTALTSVTNYSTATTYNKLSYDITYNGASVVANFDLTAENTGILTILQRHITVYTASESKEYDGAALSNGNYKTYLSSTTVTDATAEDGLVGNDRLTVVGDLPSITNFGTQENSINFRLPNDNYVIDDVKAGTLEITKRPIKVETSGDEKTYDGYALSCGDITATYGGEKEGQPAFLLDGEELIIVGNLPTRTDAGSSDNTIGFRLPNTENYYVSETVYGKLVVKKRKIGVRLLSYSVVYGDSYSYPTGAGNYEEIYEGSLAVVDGVSETLEITDIYFEFGNAQYPDAREEVYRIGTRGFNVTKVDGTEGHDNYILSWEGGELTVTKRPIIVNIEDTECVYGEAELPTPNFTVTGVEGKDGLVNGEKLNITSFNRVNEDGEEPSRFDAGKYTVSVGDEYTFTDASGKPLTAKNYEIIDCNTGTLTITKRPITITLKDLMREYGESSSSSLVLYDDDINDALEIGGALAAGETLSNLHLRSLEDSDGNRPTMKNVGTYEISICHFVVTRAGGSSDIIVRPIGIASTTSNYEISSDSVLTATLTVTPKDLTVDLNDVELTYGEREKALDGYLVEVTDGLAFRESLSLSEVFAANKSGLTVADSYLDAGDYTINANAYDAVIYSRYGKEIENGYKNYNIKFVAGNLNVKQRAFTVTLNDMPNAVYGDEIKYVAGGEEASGLLDWHRFEINPDNISFGDNSAAPEYLNVGDYTINANEGFIKIYNGETEVTENYKIAATGGSLTVTAREITVTLDNATSVYGEMLGVPQTTVTNLVNNDEFNIDYLYLKDGEMPARYDVGDYDIYLDEEKCSFVYTNGAPSSTPNYQVVLSAASTLTVTKRPITVTLKDLTREYGEIDDGVLNLYNDDVNEALEISGEYGLAEGETLRILQIWTLQGSDGKRPTMKNVGSYDVEIFNFVVRRANADLDYILSVSPSMAESNYELSADSVLTATLTVTPKAVEFDLGSIELTYGDKDNALDGYTFNAQEGLAFNQTVVLSNFALVGWEASPNLDYRLAVGNYGIDPNRFTVTVYAEDGTEDTYGSANYVVTVKGELVIKPKTITVQLLDFYNRQEEYFYGDGEKLVYPAYIGNYISDDELAYGQQLQIVVSWSLNGENVSAPKNAGAYVYSVDSENSLIYDGESFASGLNNYDIQASKSVTIKPVAIRLELPDMEIVYGDALPFVPYEFIEIPDENVALRYEGETLKVKIVYYDGNEYAYGRKVEVIPKDAGGYIYYAPDYMTYDADGTPHTVRNYDLEVCEGSLYINQREISVKAIDLPDVVYGDEAVSYPVYTDNHGEIGLNGLPEGQRLQINSVEYYGEYGNLIDGVPTEVGVYYIVPVSVTVYDENGNEVDTDKNYKISYTEIPDCGTVRILPREILLETNTHLDWVYNGEYQYDTDFTLWLLDDSGNKIKTIDSPENVIVLDYTKLKEAGDDVVDNEVVYDFSLTNYSISQRVWGLLKVNYRPITVQTATNLDNLIYNGEEQYDDGFKITVGTLADGQEIEVSARQTVTTVDQGVVENRLTYKIFDGEEEVTSNYKITDDFGSIKINPRPITVETATNTDNWTYNGGEFSDYNYSLIGGTLVDGHVMSVIGGTKIADVSDPVDNDLTFEIIADGDDVTVNYAITQQYGKLKVNALHISIALNGYPDLIYGEPTYPDEFDNYDLANSTPLVAGERLRVTVKYVNSDGIEFSSVKNVGTYTVKYNGKYVEKADGKISTDNYVIDDATDGSVTVSPKEIGFGLENLSKVYGDDFAGYPTYAIYDNLEYGEAMTVTVDYSEDIDKTTNAGKYAIKIASCTIAGVTYGNPVNGVIDCGNYIITFTDGELEITARRLIVTSGSATKPYDGIALTCTDFNLAKTYAYGGGVGILDWDKEKTVLKYIEGTANSIINVGRTYNRARFESVSDNYVVYSHAVGTLEITKVAIEISLKEITGEYFYGDTVNYYTGAGNYDGGVGLVGGETLEIGVAFKDEDGNFAQPKAVGVYTYAYDADSSVVYNSIGGAGIDNYEITCVNDYEYSVEISRVAITITLDNWDSEEYNGYAHEYGGNYTVTEGAFAYDERLEIAVKYYKDGAEISAPVNAGEYFVQYDAANSRIGNDLPDRNYDIIILPEDGISFTIRPKNITISMGDERRIYNGMAYNYPTDNLNFVADAADGEKIIPVVSYQDGEAPKNAGTYRITLTDFTVENGLTANYSLVNKSALENGEIFCNLTIDKRDISFAVIDASIELGNDIPKASYTVGGYGFVGEEQNELVPVYTYYAIGEGGALTPVTEEELNVRGEYAVGLSFIDENGVLDNYNVVGNEYGILEITARKVTVNIMYTGGDFTYNGDPISLDGLTYSHVHTTNPTESGFLADNIPEHRYSFTDAKGNVAYDAPVNAGTYTVKVEFLNVDEDDYAIYNEGSVTITVKPREVTVEITCNGYDDLIYTNTNLSRDGVEIAFNGILEKDEGDYTVDWYFYNKTMGRRVTVDYSGDYYVMPEVKGANDNYVIVDYEPTVLFTIAKITVYVTPVGEKVQYEGKSLSLTEYEIRYGAFLDGDELTITGSSVLSTTVRATVTIKSASVTQNGLDITNCYDIHYKYEASDPFNGDKAWYTRENFSAVLEFIPIDIYYEQAVLDTREFAYDGTAHTLYHQGVDISANGFDLSTLITIQNAEDFIGNCTLKLSLMQVKNVLVYKKWIIIQVLNGANKNVTTLYNFHLLNEQESQVVVKGYDFTLEINGDVDDAALKTALENNDSTVFSGTALYGNNEYHILNSSLYTASGLDKLGHACEVLVREVNGNVTVKVIVYGTSASGTRTEASLYYDFTVATSLSDVSMSLMALLKFDATN